MKEINTVNQKSLPECTADAIVAMLHMENYKAGAKLPNEIQMAQRFEVSRSTIRLAERLLADRDILDIQRGAGTFVSHKLGVSGTRRPKETVPEHREIALAMMLSSWKNAERKLQDSVKKHSLLQEQELLIL